MDDSGEIRDDLRLPDGELGSDIEKRFESDETSLITILSAMGEEAAIAVKNMPK